MHKYGAAGTSVPSAGGLPGVPAARNYAEPMAATGTSVDSGTVLGNRFVLSERIGIGMSSRVYLAVDRRLQTRVAVKVLHESLAADPRFLEQFTREANASARLAHDHIVPFIDSGTHDVDGLSVPYIATAFMAGGSMASMIAAGHRLDVAQAVSVGLQASDALAMAHRVDLVHRDVKPANLLFDDQGRLRLADFGIARAIAAASITEPLGSSAGTTRYASPEQMQGRTLDGRSDVYSLALVLIEAVTGIVPLLADTLAGTISMRANRDVDVSMDFGVLREPLLAATTYDPAGRCTAADLLEALQEASEEVPEAMPLALVPPAVAAHDTSELDFGDALGAEVAHGVSVDDSEADSEDHVPGDEPALAAAPILGGALVADGESEELLIDLVETNRRGPIEVAQENAAFLEARPGEHGPVEPLETSTSKAPLEPPHGLRVARRWRSPRRWAWIALVAVVLIASGTAGWWYFVRVPTHEVPDWVGQDSASLVGEAADLGWEVANPEEIRRDGTTVGEVLAQDPQPGEELAEGETIAFTVSLGATLTELPALSNVPEADAVAAIEAAGLVLGARGSDFNEDVPAGLVMLAAPADGSEAPDDQGRVPKGTAIDILVSDGPAPRAVPEGLEGLASADARARLEAVQLSASEQSQYSDSVDEGVVISVGTPAGTEVARGTAVVLVVSAGPEPIVVPNVTGKSGAAAAAALEAAGFTVSGIEGSPSGVVLATDPVAGESRERGSSVRIFTRQ